MTGSVVHSLVVPVYQNEENIPDLLAAVEDLAMHVTDLEAIFVVDGSPDQSFALLEAALPTMDFESQLLSHSRNFGAFTAVRTGMAAARGAYIATMAADLQEPPKLILDFFEVLGTGESDIVFGTRTSRDDPKLSRALSKLYWWTYRRFVLPEVPRGGADVFACTRQVRDAVLSMSDSNTSLVSQMFWVGFRRSYVPYERQKRDKGTSSWSIRRRFRYMADSLFSFSDLPILVLAWIGILGLAFSAFLGVLTLVGRLMGLIEVPGFATILITVLFLFSVLIASQGIIGMYLWRTFENGTGKPIGIVMSRETWAAGDTSESDQPPKTTEERQ